MSLGPDLNITSYGEVVGSGIVQSDQAAKICFMFERQKFKENDPPSRRPYSKRGPSVGVFNDWGAGNCNFCEL